MMAFRARDPSNMPPSEPRKIGPFLLMEKIGSGGMASVYLAEHEENQRKVAVKVLSAKMSGSKRGVARFNRELSIMTKMRHPNIVRCYGGGRAQGQHFLAMELVRGGSLAQVIRRRGKFNWEAAIDFSLQACAALEYAHEQGIVHRDITPGNLLLTEKGTLKIADFGLARVASSERLTATRHTLGTVAYMSPEQIRGGKDVTHKTDLYALGCVMFEMLTGRLPFMAEGTAEMLYQHMEEIPPRVSTIALDCPVWLDGIITQLLEKNPDQRPQDASAVARALREIRQRVIEGDSVTQHAAAGGASALSVSQDATSVVKRLAPRRPKKKVRDDSPFYERAWFLMLALALLIGFATFMLWPKSEDWYYEHAAKLMSSEDTLQWDEARRLYLEPWGEKFPNGKHAEKLREFNDQIEMEEAERQAVFRASHDRLPESEGERLYMAARRMENFGDRVTAREMYLRMLDLSDTAPENRPYFNLARKKLAAIEESGAPAADFVENALKRADELYSTGKGLESRKIWTSIVDLYSGIPEVEGQVKRAQAKLDQAKGKGSASEFPASPDSSSDGDSRAKDDSDGAASNSGPERSSE